MASFSATSTSSNSLATLSIKVTSVSARYNPSSFVTLSRAPNCFRTSISCSAAAAETLKTVQITIAKQLSIDESNVAPGTKFADLGADSLDTVEIMMALEEKFGVTVGESGAENISTVQDAADLIEKVKSAA